MILMRKPSTEAWRTFLASQSRLGFSYPASEATATVPPVGYFVDHTRIRLGAGQPVFELAKAALRRWEQFNVGWMQAWSPDESIKAGGLVAVAARSFGLWWLNACRIRYVVEEQVGPVVRFAFAYGTLPGHVEMGEERFLVEWDRSDDGVWYDILAFSRPRHVLARLGRPWVRRLQKRFARDSAAAMVRAVGDSTSLRLRPIVSERAGRAK
jgi:uncharacterized protein (UPF0548 family)